MTQDTRVCRFCLESRTTKKNPLLDPCECKGSIQFVHEMCLARWRRMDPGRNSIQCLICMTPYKLFHVQALEMMPDEPSIAHMFLRFPMLLCFIVNYCLLLQSSFPRSIDLYTLTEFYQYLFQLIYFLLFWRAWKVRNRGAYWQHWTNTSTSIIVTCYLVSNGLVHYHYFVAVVPINILLGVAWHRHKTILRTLNLEL
jgi:hypothetical protein